MIDKKQKKWTEIFLNNEMAYPCEYVIRIFKGAYPKLNLSKRSFVGKKICDVGCGDGRNFGLLKQCGFDIYGVEINKEITNKAKVNLKKAGVKADIRVGQNDIIPFDSEYFDYLLSWNACYYMGENMEFRKHVEEFARTLKKSGYLIMSIPKKSCFIYRGSEAVRGGYRIIRNDPFGVRNGHILKMFRSENEIKKAFAPYFKNFIFAIYVSGDLPNQNKVINIIIRSE